jgi:hypothetical protein
VSGQGVNMVVNDGQVSGLEGNNVLSSRALTRAQSPARCLPKCTTRVVKTDRCVVVCGQGLTKARWSTLVNTREL